MNCFRPPLTGWSWDQFLNSFLVFSILKALGLCCLHLSAQHTVTGNASPYTIEMSQMRFLQDSSVFLGEGEEIGREALTGDLALHSVLTKLYHLMIKGPVCLCFILPSKCAEYLHGPKEFSSDQNYNVPGLLKHLM